MMLAEYASLYARIAGWTTSVKPAPMTLEEGNSIQDQATHFVLNIMSPILGYVHTSKVHKLLAHLMDSIRYHGNLSNGNTSTNESAHKSDKKFYRRTNMVMTMFTVQLVRQAQGSREVVRKHNASDARALLSHPLVSSKKRCADWVSDAAANGASAGGGGGASAGAGGGASVGNANVAMAGGAGEASGGGGGGLPVSGCGGASAGCARDASVGRGSGASAGDADGASVGGANGAMAGGAGEASEGGGGGLPVSGCGGASAGCGRDASEGRG